MGNSATKEQRPHPARLRSNDARSVSSPAGSGPSSPSYPPSQDRLSHPVYNVRTGRGSRPDLSTLLGMRGNAVPDASSLETRRETKQEREARKLEKEKVVREKERERSMREESVDGGFLVTQGVYTGVEDYNKGVVRQLMIERRIAPFWRGLNDHSDSWTENQLVAAARGRPIPAPDEIPVDEEPKSMSKAESETKSSEPSINNLTIPIISRSQSFNSETSSNPSPSQSSFPPGAMNLSQPSSSSGSTLFRGRAKTLAALTTSSKTSPTDLTPREMNLPRDPHVAGQPLEAYLYKDASECPICFLYYPPYLNKTRCCDQAICSECFVQIKRPEPHPPEHTDPTAPRPSPAENANAEVVDPEEFVSEPAACPFCVQPEFGVTYDSPPFRRGLTYVNQASNLLLANRSSAMSSESSLGSVLSNGGRMSPTNATRRRTTSVSATSPSVITTDKVRPDWHQKLAAARAHTARRSAAATALHTAAYLMGNRGQESDGRALGPFGRRGILRRTSGADYPVTNSAHLNMLALMSERYAASGATRGDEGEPSMTPGPRRSSRRNGVDDLEEMMMMEAIRLSLASEEDRRKKEEKDAQKKAKKKDREDKKAEKKARKTGVYSSSSNANTAGLGGDPSELFVGEIESFPYSGKGKGVQQTESEQPNSRVMIATSSSTATDPQEHLERARAHLLPSDAPPFSSPYSSSPYRPSHLRTLSNASSSTSSIDNSAPASLKSDIRGQESSLDVSPSASGVNIPVAGSAQDTYISGTPPGGEAGLEPMFNFRSLAAMVGEEKSKDVTHEENAGHAYGRPRGDSSSSMTDNIVPEEGTSTEIHDGSGSQSTGMSQPPPLGEGPPAFKLTAASRENSNFDKAGQQVEYTEINDATVPQ
ncbi:MAG: SNF1-interacting protein [Alectoria fallacina]|uniref:SNF1-interacting protein n=1 Tax=Alectoria fallacina TaxID=1903189 RepID=A0A8H3FGD5_9LECA|nr:MAG: SNF1-interacting protein [Alectoria fallacina]